MSQIVPADDAAKEVAETVTKLRELEDRLVRAGLFDHAAKLREARGALASVGLEMRRDASAAYAAARRGEELKP